LFLRPSLSKGMNVFTFETQLYVLIPFISHLTIEVKSD